MLRIQELQLNQNRKYLEIYRNTDIYIPKNYWLISENRLMTFNEIYWKMEIHHNSYVRWIFLKST